MIKICKEQEEMKAKHWGIKPPDEVSEDAEEEVSDSLRWVQGNYDSEGSCSISGVKIRPQDPRVPNSKHLTQRNFKILISSNLKVHFRFWQFCNLLLFNID